MSNALTRSSLQRATRVIDNSEPNKFGGKLEKAKLSIFEVSTDSPVAIPKGELACYINPHTIKIDKEVEFKEEPHSQSLVSLKYSHTKPMCLTLGELWFDSYDTRESVRLNYIDTLEGLLDYNPNSHVVNAVVFTWGMFSMATRHISLYVFAVSKLEVEYNLFLPDGTPVRAKAMVHLRQLTTAQDIMKLITKQSPDHARLYTVQRGDTLQGIAVKAYEDPKEWRRIAKTNGIDDPMGLRPGMQLMLPPILK